MSRTPARFTQADVARTLRAAKQAGALTVEVTPNGSFLITLSDTLAAAREEKQLEEDSEIVL